MYKYLSVFFLFILAISSSQAAFVTFEPPPCMTCGFLKTSYTEGDFSISGMRDDASVVQQSFRLDGLIDGSGGRNDYETFTFSSLFTDLVYVDILSDIFSLDNIQYSVVQSPPPPPSSVPTPSTLLLFLVGLTGLMINRKSAD